MPYNVSSMNGRYQAGDPFLGGIVKGIGGFVGGALNVASSIVPGPLGAVAGIASRAIGGGGRRRAAAPIRAPQRVAPAGGMQRRGGRAKAVMTDACPKGERLNKTDYFLSDGTFVPAGSRCVSIRRRNPANARALNRALAREESFIRLARRSGLVTVPKAKRVRRAARKRH